MGEKEAPFHLKDTGSACWSIFLSGDGPCSDQNAFAPGSAGRPCSSSLKLPSTNICFDAKVLPQLLTGGRQLALLPLPCVPHSTTLVQCGLQLQ